MKNLTTLKRSAALLLVMLTLAAFPMQQGVSGPVDMDTEIQNAYDPTGTWNYEVETPDGNLTGEMTIKKVDGEFEVKIESDVYGTLELEDITFEKMVMEASIEIEGDQIEFEWEFDGDSMEGTVYSGEDELAMTAERASK